MNDKNLKDEDDCLKSSSTDYTGLQRNLGKHKNTHFYLIWGCWIQIWNPFLLITSSFFRYA